MKTTETHILSIEDNPTDAQLIQRQILKISPNSKIQVVDNMEDIAIALKSFSPQLVISDYNLPTCSGMDVLNYVRAKSPSAIFIFLTGTLQDEELAAETILNGADGFILKKHINNLSSKLLPYFERIKNRPIVVQNAKNRIKQSSDLIDNIKEYMDDINRENLSHQERIAKMREHLNKMKESL